MSGAGTQAAIDADRVGRQILAGFGIVIAVEIIVQPDSRILPLSWEEQREGGGFAFRANIAATAFAQQRAGGARAAPEFGLSALSALAAQAEQCMQRALADIIDLPR
ncbi:hypothetical protein [Sphingomonas sanguinis]|uniref:Uncharacterized protein n=1 Tax=Sphingomonas sanguinis TaxID=33051 RepID=A0A147J1N6_9SPHN|nr:hypothetical protein [Sphingomonas sanguinis]KTW02359.1 hypothetical protein SB4_03705 [Sphingomonas sanguinis]